MFSPSSHDATRRNNLLQAYEGEPRYQVPSILLTILLYPARPAILPAFGGARQESSIYLKGGIDDAINGILCIPAITPEDVGHSSFHSRRGEK